MGFLRYILRNLLPYTTGRMMLSASGLLLVLGLKVSQPEVVFGDSELVWLVEACFWFCSAACGLFLLHLYDRWDLKKNGRRIRAQVAHIDSWNTDPASNYVHADDDAFSTILDEEDYSSHNPFYTLTAMWKNPDTDEVEEFTSIPHPRHPGAPSYVTVFVSRTDRERYWMDFQSFSYQPISHAEKLYRVGTYSPPEQIRSDRPLPSHNIVEEDAPIAYLELE